MQFWCDLADRLTSELWMKPGTSQIARTLAYAYDDANQLKLASDPSSRLAFTYDNAEQVKTANNAGTPLVPNVVLTSSYDVAGHRTRLANTMPSALAGTPTAATAGFISYAYDAAGRMTRIQDGTFSGPSISSRSKSISRTTSATSSPRSSGLRTRPRDRMSRGRW